MKTITTSPTHYKKGMAAVVYAGKNIPIRTNKTVTKSNGKVKNVEYGPIDHYGSQTKTKTVVKNGKTRVKKSTVRL